MSINFNLGKWLILFDWYWWIESSIDRFLILFIMKIRYFIFVTFHFQLWTNEGKGSYQRARSRNVEGTTGTDLSLSAADWN